jgi:predicted amidohydrolase YtcJ
VDSHVHSLVLGRATVSCNLDYVALTEAAFLTRIQACIDRDVKSGKVQPDNADKFLLVVNWDRSAYVSVAGKDATYATLASLKTKRPVYVGAADGHSGLINERAIAISGWNATTPDPRAFYPCGNAEADCLQPAARSSKMPRAI